MDCENVEVCLAIVWFSLSFFILLYSCFIFNIFQGIRYMIWYVHGPWPSCGAPTLRLRLRSGVGCLRLGRFKALQASAKVNDLTHAMNEAKPFRSVDIDIGGNKVYSMYPFCTVSLYSGALAATTPLSSSLERTVWLFLWRPFLQAFRFCNIGPGQQ